MSNPVTKRNIVIRRLGNQKRPALVLLHGWGFDSDVWQPLLEPLQQSFYLYLIDLPGYGRAKTAESKTWDLNSLMTEFALEVSEPAIWCGWSLGGMLAAHYAKFQPEGVKAVLTIASNPVFVANQDWPNAMPHQVFTDFVSALSAHPQTTLNRFAGLVTQGAASSRADLRLLKPLLQNAPTPEHLMASLVLLSELDLRRVIAEIKAPQCHIFGEKDALVPLAAAHLSQGLNPQAAIKIITGASHIPWISDASHLLAVINAFLISGDLSE